MANNTATHRIVSTRIPIEKYIETLEKAKELKMSISDYTMLSIFKSNADGLLDNGKHITIEEHDKIVDQKVDNIRQHYLMICDKHIDNNKKLDGRLKAHLIIEKYLTIDLIKLAKYINGYDFKDMPKEIYESVKKYSAKNINDIENK